MPKLIAKKNSSTKDIGKLNSNCYKGKKKFFNEWPKEACRCRLKNLFSKIIDFLKHFFTHFTFMRKTKKNCIINFSHKNFSLENSFFLSFIPPTPTDCVVQTSYLLQWLILYDKTTMFLFFPLRMMPNAFDLLYINTVQKTSLLCAIKNI